MAVSIQRNEGGLTLNVSKGAAEELRTVLQDQGRGTVIRVFVQLGGGCEGGPGDASPRFGMALDTLKGGDRTLDVGEVRLVADEVSSSFLKEADIEFVRDGSDSGFRISTPNASASGGDSRGCGGGSCNTG